MSSRMRRWIGRHARPRLPLGWIAGLCMTIGATATVDGGELRQLTSGPGNDTEACWSPDGRQIVFQTDRDGTLDLYVLDAASLAVRPLVVGPGHAAFPAWSRDGKWIAYSYAHFTETAFEGEAAGYNLYLAPAGGGTPRRITHGRCRDYAPVFAADGKTLWFSSDRGGTEKSNAVSLYAVDLAGGEPRVVLPRDGTDRAAVQATLSSDGRWFACGAIAGFRDNWRIRLARVDRPDDGLALTDARTCFYGPRWSPTAAVLACTGFEPGDAGWNAWLLDPRTGQRLRLTVGPGQSRSPAWSPDGRRIALENNRSGTYKLYCLDAPPMPVASRLQTLPADEGTVLRFSLAKRPETDVIDLSPMKNNGRLHGAPAWRDGAVSFSSSGTAIAVSKAKGFAFGNRAFAVRAVVQTAADAKFSMIAMGEYPGNRLGWQLFLDDNRRACFNSRTVELVYRGARSDEPLPVGRPVTLAGVRDAAGRVQLYVDGALQQAAGAEAQYVYGEPVQVRIGTQYNGTAGFAGWIHDVAVFRRALTDVEVRGDALTWFWAARSEQP